MTQEVFKGNIMEACSFLALAHGLFFLAIKKLPPLVEASSTTLTYE